MRHYTGGRVRKWEQEQVKKQISILIVDDDRERTERIKNIFGLEGVRVLFAESIEQMARDAASYTPSIFVLNYALPVAEKIGFPLIAGIRRVHNSRLLVLIPECTVTERSTLRMEGADILLQLPPAPQEYEAAIRALIRTLVPIGYGYGSEPGGYILYDKLTIDSVCHRVTLDGAEVVLTAKEFKILLLLAKCPGWIFSKEVIYQMVWEEDSNYGCRSVTDHISAIRKKLKATGCAGDYIETVHRVGYRFRDQL